MAQSLNRRTFISGLITSGTRITLGATLLNLSACGAGFKRPNLNLTKDPAGICDLPKGFNYRIISIQGATMSDGYSVPEMHDGMGCFKGPNNEIILVCNHEISANSSSDSKSPAPLYAYDSESGGGTTTIWLNNQLEVTQHYLSLTGTIRNCSGGKTPWGTWISCEESGNSTWRMGKRHGYNFEVNPLDPLKLAHPLKAMGRFNHEAVAIDPLTGIAYQTEDNRLGCFYRFIPNVRQHFEKGGSLQALKFVDAEIKHTTDNPLKFNKKYLCEWVDIDQPDPEENTIRLEAQGKGATIFVRGEGIVTHADGIYFSCTEGGALAKGQIFKYTPGQNNEGGSIEIVYESTNSVLENPDNLTTNQWGDLIICEDNKLYKRRLVGLTSEGKIYYIASNTISEWAGACFSPDGKTLFANIQKRPGMTVAIQGPWQSLREAVV